MSDADLDYVRLRDYLANRLPENESCMFEDRLQSEPELARDLDLSLKFVAGLARLKLQSQLAASSSRHRLRWTNRVLAAAATVACVSLLLWVWIHRAAGPALLVSTADPGPATLAARPIVAHFAFMATRESSVPNLDLPPNGLIELRAAPSRRALGLRYTVTLIAHEPTVDRPLAALNGLAASADGFVRFYADASQLRPGTYDLRLETDSGTDVVKDEFTFNLRAKPLPYQ